MKHNETTETSSQDKAKCESCKQSESTLCGLQKYGETNTPEASAGTAAVQAKRKVVSFFFQLVSIGACSFSCRRGLFHFFTNLILLRGPRNHKGNSELRPNRSCFKCELL